MKFKFYNNITEFENDKTKNETDLSAVVRNGYIDFDTCVQAKTKYLAFKKVATQLAKNGYDILKYEMTYKDDFIEYLNNKDWMKMIEYPDEQINGSHGYSIEEIGDDAFYIRYFEPIERS